MPGPTTDTGDDAGEQNAGSAPESEPTDNKAYIESLKAESIANRLKAKATQDKLDALLAAQTKLAEDKLAEQGQYKELLEAANLKLDAMTASNTTLQAASDRMLAQDTQEVLAITQALGEAVTASLGFTSDTPINTKLRMLRAVQIIANDKAASTPPKPPTPPNNKNGGGEGVDKTALRAELYGLQSSSLTPIDRLKRAREIRKQLA